MTRLFPRLKKFCFCTSVRSACPSFRITSSSLVVKSCCTSPLSPLRCKDWKGCQSPGLAQPSAFHKLLNLCGVVGTMLRTKHCPALFNRLSLKLTKWTMFLEFRTPWDSDRTLKLLQRSKFAQKPWPTLRYVDYGPRRKILIFTWGQYFKEFSVMWAEPTASLHHILTVQENHREWRTLGATDHMEVFSVLWLMI